MRSISYSGSSPILTAIWGWGQTAVAGRMSQTFYGIQETHLFAEILGRVLGMMSDAFLFLLEFGGCLQTL